jgi:uncharacterized membrane protein (DUF485 family)
MTDVTARGAGEGAGAPGRPGTDWERIERSPEFRELTSRRHRFIAVASAVSLGWFLVYLLLATFAPDVMGAKLGGVPVAFLAAVSQVLMTWAVTSAYLRKADREFAPLEQRVIQAAAPRFTREEPAPDGAAPADGTRTQRRTR